MSSALALMLCVSLTAADAAAAPAGNLDFGGGNLTGWEGEGFYVTTGTARGPGLACGVCSSDRDGAGRTALLHRTFVVPPGAGVLQCTAYAVRPKDAPPEEALDVVLLAAGKRVIPKQAHTVSGWRIVSCLQTKDRGEARVYVWNLTTLIGQTLRIALIDDDKRPGCHVWCSGFRIVPCDEFEPRDFSRFMLHLTRESKLPPATRFDSGHFMALSNAEDDYTAKLLNNCELIHGLFYEHFRVKGFHLSQPPSKLMVAIFDSQSGFEACLGRKMRANVTGVFHVSTNRLVVYDYGQNNSFMAARRQAQQQGKSIATDMERIRFIETVNRKAGESRTGTNIVTIMHEVAHQLSFNSGMLNREGDVPLWLAEGLACYCEATDNGAWQGIGELAPERIASLAAAGEHCIPLRNLLTSDDWLRKDTSEEAVLLGYAQSWALFRMLMEERPQALRAFLTLIYDRRTPDARLIDFGQIFPDLARLEVHYQEYVQELVKRHHHPHR